VEIRGILNFDSGFPSLSECHCNLSGFNDGLLLNESHPISPQIYDLWDKGFSILVKCKNLSGSVENEDVERMTGNIMKFRYPCMAGVIGVVFPLWLTGLKLVRIDLGDI
jgi:hypothetical protein